MPPLGATAAMSIPLVAQTGIRQTVNANLSAAQTTWNLRSALNVAALNCQDPQFAGLVDNYSAFLKRNDKQLSATNRVLQGEFRQRYGAKYRDIQDTYMTQVYNYFALPPAKRDFCQVAFGVSGEVIAIEPGQLDLFASTALPRIESVFENFFRAYEKYRSDLDAWNAQYGRPEVTVTVQELASVPGDQAQVPLPAAGPIFVSGEVTQGQQDTQPPASAEDGTPIP